MPTALAAGVGHCCPCQPRHGSSLPTRFSVRGAFFGSHAPAYAALVGRARLPARRPATTGALGFASCCAPPHRAPACRRRGSAAGVVGADVDAHRLADLHHHTLDLAPACCLRSGAEESSPAQYRASGLLLGQCVVLVVHHRSCATSPTPYPPCPADRVSHPRRISDSGAGASADAEFACSLPFLCRCSAHAET